MIVFCTICSDLINQSENIFVTKCGHLFHYDCLHTWIVKSKSCPQCRHHITEKCMFRVFPTTTDNIPSRDENAANLQTKLNHTLFTLNKQGLELKSCYDNFTKFKTVLETYEKCIKILEEKFASKTDLEFQLKKVHEESEIQKENVRALQGALYQSESMNNELHSRLLAARQELTEEKEMGTEWHIKFLQIEENFSTLVKKYEGMKNEIKKTLCSEDSWYMSGFNTPLPSNSAEETSNTSLNTLMKTTENADFSHLNLEQRNLAYAALQHPTTSKRSLLKHITIEKILQPLKLKSLQVSATKMTQSASGQNGNLSAFNYKNPCFTDCAMDKHQSRSTRKTLTSEKVDFDPGDALLKLTTLNYEYYDVFDYPTLRTIPLCQEAPNYQAKRNVRERRNGIKFLDK